ncbi:SpoIIE family protein phosphatase [Candidatus Sumerlaeota bacterium]
MAKLVVTSGVDTGRTFPITEGSVSLGRSVSNTIQLNDKRLSRLHARIYQQAGKLFVQDAQSTNGTFVNGERLFGEHQLVPDDLILIGNTEICFEADPGSMKDMTASAEIKIEDESWGETRALVPAADTSQVTLSTSIAPDVSEATDTKRYLRTLRRVADAIQSLFDLDELLETIIDLIFDVFQPDRGVIFLGNGPNNELTPRVTRNIEGGAAMTVSRSIIDQALADRVALLVSNTSQDRRFSASDSIIAHRIRAAICAPLICEDRILGVLYIDSQSRLMSYTQTDLALLNSIAAQASVAIANARLHQQLVEQEKMASELNVARTIQMNLLPRETPQLPGLEIAAICLPARQVGGDYYDFVELEDGLWGVAVADVSGKGVPAAILSSAIRSALQVESRHSHNDLPRMVGQLNQMVRRDSPHSMFATLLFGVLDCARHLFRYINAGHEYPLLFDASGNRRELDVGGPVLGIVEEHTYLEQTVSLEPGSLLVIYTDGVTDIQNQEEQMWTRERLSELIQNNRELAAEDLADLVYREAMKFKGHADQFDDFTLIVISSR